MGSCLRFTSLWGGAANYYKYMENILIILFFQIHNVHAVTELETLILSTQFDIPMFIQVDILLLLGMKILLLRRGKRVI